ncbi:MAG: mucoidy inhibitor MuiA family protein [Pseudomonadota bacterium]
MSTRLPFGAFCLLLLPHAAAAVEVSSRVDAATVYPAGATITRVASVRLDAGETEIIVGGLVQGIAAADLRVEIDAPGAGIGQIDIDQQQRSEAYDAEVRRLTDAIAAVNRQIAAVNDDNRSQQLKVRFLETMASAPPDDEAPAASNPANWAAALEALGGGSAAAFERIRANAVRLQELQRELGKLQRELADTRGGSLASSRVIVTASSPTAQQATLKLRYFREEAGWRPVYEARLDSDAAALNLVQQASVAQSTDERWQGVELTLSTSTPGEALAAPELDSRFLYLREPQPKRRAVMSRAEMVEAAGDMAFDEVMVTGARAPTRIGSYAVSYDIPGRVDIANETDEEQTYDLATYRFEPTLVTQVVPRQSNEAFLAARFDYDGQAPLFASDMRVFVDGVYAGMATMPDALPGRELTLPMGQDRRVEVKVVDRGEQRGDRGIISRRRTETTDFVFSLVNRRGNATEVEVLDLYPVARDDAIEVDVPRGATEPSERDVDGRPGVVSWRRTLDGGESWEIRHTYTVSYPADRVIVEQ